MTIFVTSQMNYYNAQQRVGCNKRKFGPQNQLMVRTLQGEVMSVDVLQIYVILPKELYATMRSCRHGNRGDITSLCHYVAHKDTYPLDK